MSLLAPLALALPLALFGGPTPSPAATALAFSPYSMGSLHASTQLEPAPTPEDAAAANGWDEPAEEPAADPAATDPSATAPATTDPAATVEPVPAPVVPPPTDTGIVKKPAPKPADKKGIGLIVGASAVGGVAIAMGVGRMVIISDACASGSEFIMDTGGSLTKCVTAAKNLLTFTVVEWIFNATSYGLAPAAGMVRARYDASSYVYSGKPNRNGILLAGIGGGVLGVGVIAKITLWGSLLSGKRFLCPAGSEEEILDYGKCVRRNFVGYFGGVQLASTAIAAGAGLLAYGVFYNKDRQAKERLFFRPEQVRVSPTFSHQYAGLSLTGRF
ncbi:MAG: hypothetical protein H6712_12165 [Myxococcales bacterium]|nr:hypothetical protein [Myxococcales bacterium]MCB9714611.1 hypothetical protein [Myxococcales bacterium]